MTIDEAVSKAAAAIDEIFAQNASDFEALLIWHGATDEEFTREMEIAERTRVEERARVLADLRQWLERGCETLH